MGALINFAAGFFVGLLLIYIAVAMLSLAWSLARDLRADRLVEDTLARYHRTKFERTIQWIAIPILVLFGVAAALGIPAMFIEHNKDNSAVLSGGAIALVVALAFLGRIILRRREKG